MAELENIDHSLVTVGQPTDGGCVYVSPYTPDLTLPTDAETKMNTLTDFKSAGDLSQDGFTKANSKTKNDQKNWNEETVLSNTSEETNTYKLAFIEINRPVVAELRYGIGNVETGEDGSVSEITEKVGVEDEWAIVIDELESNGYLRRTVIERASIDSVDDESHNKSGLVTYGMTFKVLKGKGDIVKQYRAKPAVA